MLMLLALTALLAACIPGQEARALGDEAREIDGSEALATFAGGCFWCVESAFDGIDGVLEAVSGYIGGEAAGASYEDVSSGRTAHFEAVEVRYDPSRITYEELLDIFWRQIDPTDAGGQFVDGGSQYRSAVFWHDDEQRTLAEASRDALAANGPFDEPIVTEIVQAGPFFPAEEYHQDFYEKRPLRYRYYRRACGRNQRVEEIWGERAYQGIPDHR